MSGKSLHIMIFPAMLLTGIATLHAQSGFYVPQQGKIYFSGNISTIYGNVINKGDFGIGNGAIVNFKGQSWSNDQSSQIPDESLKGVGTVGVGGIVRFLTPDTSLPASVSQLQTITGGYNAAVKGGASFPNLFIVNPSGVQLTNGSAKVRGRLHFSNGHVYTNDNILVVGDRNPGQITGYGEERFVVTGSSIDGTGMLLREKIQKADKAVVFPVGTADGKYTPAAIHTHSQKPGNFYVRVADGVKGRITDGDDLSERSVGKVWQVGQLERPGESVVDVSLQHRLEDEGNIFMAHREQTYVSQYANGSWDVGDPKTRPSAGTLADGVVLVNSGLNSRTFRYTLTPASYFTKFAGFDDTSSNRTNLWFSAYRTSRDSVWVYWTTRPEIRNKFFIVQRRYIWEPNFSNRDTVFSQAPGGISLHALDYHLSDPNSYTGVTYYRLLMIDYNGNITYSHIVAVGGEPQGFGWTLWPNPTPGRFFVGISRPSLVKEVMVWDIVGRLMHRETVGGRGLIGMELHVKGAYVVGLIPFDGSHIETKKLIVIGD